jgi:hypothetical protein
LQTTCSPFWLDIILLSCVAKCVLHSIPGLKLSSQQVWCLHK